MCDHCAAIRQVRPSPAFPISPNMFGKIIVTICASPDVALGHSKPLIDMIIGEAHDDVTFSRYVKQEAMSVSRTLRKFVPLAASTQLSKRDLFLAISCCITLPHAKQIAAVYTSAIDSFGGFVGRGDAARLTAAVDKALLTLSPEMQKVCPKVQALAIDFSEFAIRPQTSHPGAPSAGTTAASTAAAPGHSGASQHMFTFPITPHAHPQAAQPPQQTQQAPKRILTYCNTQIFVALSNEPYPPFETPSVQPNTISKDCPRVMAMDTHASEHSKVVNNAYLTDFTTEGGLLSKARDPCFRPVHLLMALPLYVETGPAQIQSHFTVPAEFRADILSGKLVIHARLFSRTQRSDLQFLAMHQFFINRQRVDLSNSGKRIHVPKNYEHKNRVMLPRSADISRYTNPGAANSLLFLPFGEYHLYFYERDTYFLLEILEPLPLAKLVEKVEKRPRVAGIELAVSLLSKTDDEIDVPSSLQVSLTCPLTLAVLRLPARGVSCKHVQCFELETYISVCSRQRTWICPICSQPTAYRHLRIDDQLNTILKERVTNAPLSTRLTVFPSGSYSFMKDARPLEDEDDDPSAKRPRVSSDQGLDVDAMPNNRQSDVIELD
ncbi:hypothetical protein CAOG_009991 [Capsaspora owczarzaki ATCC 30864]|uniref:SP-RING-type domain-containing protein n=1 Tax=Capsaspora owczarzaki (strain ATCC 30864) TaxID=595528 RepID=A0A0D2VWX3_CAPO3|nr:hypothetical protein CAOG_009991 [Capsaspora owczarzaki ATCC 30864]